MVYGLWQECRERAIGRIGIGRRGRIGPMGGECREDKGHLGWHAQRGESKKSPPFHLPSLRFALSCVFCQIGFLSCPLPQAKNSDRP
jgi:hypothetical protein